MIAGVDEHDYMLAKKQAQVLRISVAEFVRRVIRDERFRSWGRIRG